MIRTFFSVLMASAFACVAMAADGGELDKMQGKWESTRTSDEGQKVKQTIELKKDKMVYKVADAGGATVFAATADVKTQKSGAFQTFTISNIKAGRDEDSLEEADGERSYVYMLNYQTLTVVSNIDEERERPPVLDVYKKVSAGK
ncbi:MAG: hypothetical protein ACXW32_02795 [Limisphaerales bacterium]